MRSPTYDRRLRRRGGGTVLLSFLAVALLAGCSEDSPTTQCLNCEDWVQLTVGLGRFPEPHPTNSEFVAYSSVDKLPGSLDENREADEDIWLAWIRNADDPGLNLYYQITGEEMGLGDNFAPRWNPSGSEILFTHGTPGQSEFQVWRVAVQLPTTESAPPVLGAPEMVASRGRDPDWVSDTRVIYSSALKLYSVDLPAGAGPPTGPPTQRTFDPPTYVGADTYFDRHPTTSADGITVFNTLDRRNVADVVIEAYEIDQSGPTPDTSAVPAFIYLETPDSPIPVYPVVDRADTIRTPAFLQSLPVDEGGDFRFGARMDSRFLVGVETYCDTTLTSNVNLQPNAADSLQFYFKLARGSIWVDSDLSGTTVFWTRDDGSGASASADGIEPGVTAAFDCLSAWNVDAQGVISEGDSVDYYVTSVRQTKTQRDTVRVIPGGTTFVRAFRTGPVVGRVAFSNDAIPPFPIANIAVTEQDSAFVFINGSSAAATGDFSFDLPGGLWDFQFTRGGYDTLNVNGVAVDPFSGADLGTVTMIQAQPGSTPRSIQETVTPTPFALPASAERRSTVLSRPAPASSRATTTDLRSALRAEGDVSTIWRMDLANPVRTDLSEIFGLQSFIQNPALTEEFPNGKRYVAFASDANGDWDVWIQRIDSNWQEDGDPFLIETPGVVNNFFCSRRALHPRWVPGTAPPNLRLVVTLSGCPENQFDEIGFDDDPWAQGEFRIWEVSLDGYE